MDLKTSGNRFADSFGGVKLTDGVIPGVYEVTVNFVSVARAELEYVSSQERVRIRLRTLDVYIGSWEQFG